MSSDLGDWFRSVPFFTRYMLAGSVGLSLLGRFGLINPYNLILLYEPLKRFQIWRLVTSVLYYPINPQTGFHYLLNLFFLYNYSRRLEEDTYQGKPADYCFMLIFNCICCIILCILGNVHLLMDPMVLSIVYIWCQINKNQIVVFWFGTRFKAMYLPWVLLGFNLIFSGGGFMELMGILVGHLYYFLMFTYPQELGGPSLLKTPAFLRGIFPDNAAIRGFGAPPQRQPVNQDAPRGGGGFFARHNWGRGHTLGGN